MSKKNKPQKRSDNWRIPKNAADFFDRHYDDDFKHKHPVLYWLTVFVIFILVIAAPILYIVLCSLIQTAMTVVELIFWMLGFISSFGISIGLCNLFMILHKQYLGHYVTIFSFVIGVVGSAAGAFLLWIL
jgi:hypothetical protein